MMVRTLVEHMNELGSSFLKSVDDIYDLPAGYEHLIDEGLVEPHAEDEAIWEQPDTGADKPGGKKKG